MWLFEVLLEEFLASYLLLIGVFGSMRAPIRGCLKYSVAFEVFGWPLSDQNRCDTKFEQRGIDPQACRSTLQLRHPAAGPNYTLKPKPENINPKT